MKAIYIRGNNNSNVLSSLLRDAFVEVHEVVNVVDAVGLLRLNSYNYVFIYEKTVDIPIIQADNLLSKLINKKNLYILTNEVEIPGLKGNLVHPPSKLNELSEIVQLENKNAVNGKLNGKIDLNQIIALAKGDDSFVSEILSTFIEDSQLAVDNFKKFLDNKDIQNIGKIAHKIKGPINILGVSELDKQLDDLDDLGLDNPPAIDWDTTTHSVQNIVDCLMIMRQEIEGKLVDAKFI